MTEQLLFPLGCFFAFIIFVYLPCLCLWIWRRNKKAEAFANKHGAVKCYIKRTKASDILTVHSINGEKPVMFSTSLKTGCYVLPGENVIHISYMWQPFLGNLARKIGGLTYLLGIKQHHIDAKKLKVVANADSEHELYYDHHKKQYVFRVLPAKSGIMAEHHSAQSGTSG